VLSQPRAILILDTVVNVFIALMVTTWQTLASNPPTATELRPQARRNNVLFTLNAVFLYTFARSHVQFHNSAGRTAYR
jgi:hypothetical protein